MMSLIRRRDLTKQFIVSTFETSLRSWLSEVFPGKKFSLIDEGSLRFYLSSGRKYWAGFVIRYMPNCGPIAIICDVWVDESMRGKGLGTKLQQLSIEAIRAAKSSLILLSVTENNANQISIVTKKLGFTVLSDKITNSNTENRIILYGLSLHQGEDPHAL